MRFSNVVLNILNIDFSVLSLLQYTAVALYYFETIADFMA